MGIEVHRDKFPPPAPRSMREHLARQGVTEEAAMRAHMRFIYDMQRTLLSKPDLTKYRVNPDHPNSLTLYMG